MRKFRFHRNSLALSMETCIEVESLEQLAKEIAKTYFPYLEDPYPMKNLKIEPSGYDKRIDWDTYVVTLDGNAVGFTDGPLGEAMK